MQSKLNAKKETKKPNQVLATRQSLQEPCREEFSDWPHGLLAIGTFGNKNVKVEPERDNIKGSGKASAQDHVQDITPDEVGELQKELNLILHKLTIESNSRDEHENDEQFFDTSSSMDIIRTATDTVLSRGKENLLDSTKSVIGKKSLSFLLKKIFTNRSEFILTPSLRDPLPEARLEKSRMKKIFRALLNKKIVPQSSSPKVTTAKKCLKNKQFCVDDDGEDEIFEEANDGSKWDKTDSEFIVLEI